VNAQGLVYGFKFEGEALITATSNSNPMLTETIAITMVKALPSTLTLLPANNKFEVSAGSRLRINYTLTPLIAGTVVYDQQLVWTSSNDNLAQITSSGDYGTLVANQEGTVTISAYSVMDESIEATITIRVLKPNLFTDQQYADFAAFFRKAVGHFLLFGVNGAFGYWTFYLWFNPKKQPWYVGLSLGVGLFASITSELLQAITPQRTSTVLDMVLNFTGYMTITMILWIVVFIFFHYSQPLHTLKKRNRVKDTI
jgi:VanZ family protein